MCKARLSMGRQNLQGKINCFHHLALHCFLCYCIWEYGGSFCIYDCHKFNRNHPWLWKAANTAVSGANCVLLIMGMDVSKKNKICLVVYFERQHYTTKGKQIERERLSDCFSISCFVLQMSTTAGNSFWASHTGDSGPQALLPLSPSS